MQKLIIAAAFLVLFGASEAAAKVGGGDITFAPAGAETVMYSHENHMKAGLKCSECHYQVFNTKEGRHKMTMAQMEQGLFCGKCHNGTRAFSLKGNCAKCHK